MEKYLFMKPVLEWLSHGKLLNKTFAMAIRILAVAIGFAALVGWIVAWKTVFGLSPLAMIGGIVFQVLYVVAVYIVVHTLLIRSVNISALPETEYTVIPIVSICFRLIGEIYAGFVTVMAVAGGIFTWFAGSSITEVFQSLTPFVPHFGDESLLGGLSFMVGGLLSSFGMLILMYFLSESVVVMVDLARNMKVTRQIVEQYSKTKED